MFDMKKHRTCVQLELSVGKVGGTNSFDIEDINGIRDIFSQRAIVSR